MTSRVFFFLLAMLGVAIASCPFANRGGAEQPHGVPHTVSLKDRAVFARAAQSLNWTAVKMDITQMLLTSMDFWPSDFGTYGPFMIRQAWHCTGSYRASDGLGGCDGARQRFEPELSWADNTNLDKAKTLLWPIKMKYGAGLSFGDLIVLTGNVAIESMGGPVLGFCGGRIDDNDGAWSVPLGPTKEQAATTPCAVNGNCTLPFGTTTIGLIYVNPEGPMGNPDPVASALQVRDVFGRMGMNDSETVALIGGGHAFGKAHGACPTGPGPSPKEDPSNPYPGTCGSGPSMGKGPNQFTSGFEGTWSATPTTWNNNYFTGLTTQEWVLGTSPGGKKQFYQKGCCGPGTAQIMLTTDMSLMSDPQFQAIVDIYSRSQSALDNDFSHAWYKLTTRDMGPATRCIGPDVPPPQPFQFPLPLPPATLANFTLVSADIEVAMVTSNAALAPDRSGDGRPYYGAVFGYLAWQCATTYRESDYLGGCNGARIMLPPQSTWPMNIAMDAALQILTPIKTKYGSSLSWADLIVLAGTVAVGQAGVPTKFCGGRTDATADNVYPAEYLKPNGNYSASVEDMRLGAAMAGLTDTEWVVLNARLRSPGQMGRVGYQGSWTADPGVLSNAYFTTLLAQTWAPMNVGSNVQYQAVGVPNVFMVPSDLELRWNPDHLAIAQSFASDNSLFVSAFGAAWTKVMNMDRFKGPAGNVCDA